MEVGSAVSEECEQMARYAVGMGGPTYDEARVPRYMLPDPLRMEDGWAVGSVEEWSNKRRPELLEMFSRLMYGQSPDRPRATGEVVEEKLVMGEKAKRDRVRIRLTPGPGAAAVTGELLVYKPRTPGPHPAFVGLNFKGNHSVTTETDLPISAAWFPEGKVPSRGEEASRWPIELLVSRGYALATMCYQEIEPDHAEGWRDGVRGQMQRLTGYAADQWGAVSAWAWGLSCAMDHLESDDEIDSQRVAVMGHSRLGKAALWAGAMDERFAMVISNESGEGGAALSKRCFGESIQAITQAFPHWFVGRFRDFAGNESALPIDQHELIALMAPRPVYVASAEEDRWADPRGEFLSALHAGDVYRLHELQGLGTPQMPQVERPVGDAIGYHIRRGAHGVTRYDWEQFVLFADRWFGRQGG